jgi:ribosomal protein S18 acetylase RimI-like enzyme
LVKVRKCSPGDLHAVTELAQRYTSFDTIPTFADIGGMHARNPEYFFVAENDHGKVVGFITGYERKGIPEEVLRTWNANRVGYVDLMAVDPSH